MTNQNVLNILFIYIKYYIINIYLLYMKQNNV